jgi:hypothetical protein
MKGRNMTTGEARDIVKIMATADGGCPTCVDDLVNIFLKNFDGFHRFEIYNWIEEIDPSLATTLRHKYSA